MTQQNPLYLSSQSICFGGDFHAGRLLWALLIVEIDPVTNDLASMLKGLVRT
ncbi:MAG TPA: hypothetical protein PLN02_07745 [Azonexus sp.]|nr:hypothetical protein [Azonexus sp.]